MSGLALGTIRAEAAAAGHRRLVVLAGDRDAAWAALTGDDAVGPAPVAIGRDRARDGWETLHPRHVGPLLGRGPDLVAVDLHGDTALSALGAAAGAVRAGGLLVLLCPAQERWAAAPDRLRERLAAPPWTADDVGRRVVARLASSLPRVPGARLFTVDADGTLDVVVPCPARTIPPPARGGRAHTAPAPPDGARFDAGSYRRCRTVDQRDALWALESLLDATAPRPRAVVLAADRGRGKSSALGLAAAALAAARRRVVVTAPGRTAAGELLARAAEGLPGGSADVTFAAPHEVNALAPDVLLVDEAAALSVPVLRRLAAAAPAVAFATTVHGYEGNGQGFAVRFREHLAAGPAQVLDVALSTPIRWAPGDPVEAWAREVLLLDAEPGPQAATCPAHAPLEADAVERLGPDRLAGDETLLRSLYGLLVQAHYRTTPDDLARLLDAPNVAVYAARRDGSIVATALVAAEGDLDEATCEGLFTGRFRVRGNMLPETLACHLAEPRAGALRSWRVLRIAVHGQLRGRGLGRALLATLDARADAAGVDLLGAGFAATPPLLRFWAGAGFAPVRIAVTRSRISGEHSAVVLRPRSDAGAALTRRLDAAFARRFPYVLADALREIEPDVARAALAAAARAGRPRPSPALADDDWRALVACAFGPALYDALVQPAWALVCAHLADPAPAVRLPDDALDLLVTKVLQHRPWDEAAARVGAADHRAAMRRLRAALRPLVRAYAPPAHAATVTRFRPEER